VVASPASSTSNVCVRLIHLQPGDRLILFADGVTEASNSGEEEFREQRLLDLLEANRTSTPAEIKAIILNALADFSRSNW
jgi:serine phosphatase RsbU (regulator of sigma subunit)